MPSSVSLTLISSRTMCPTNGPSSGAASSCSAAPVSTLKRWPTRKGREASSSRVDSGAASTPGAASCAVLTRAAASSSGGWISVRNALRPGWMSVPSPHRVTGI